ncbi:MAG: hypothetical protein WC560_09105 [Syntrophales bacterium]
MSVIIGGAISLILGLIGIMGWSHEFFIILKGTVPIVLLLGGTLALYIGYDELRENIREDKNEQEEKLKKAQEEMEEIKNRAELYREELERLKEKAGEGEK